jgi:hypothetical protein
MRGSPAPVSASGQVVRRYAELATMKDNGMLGATAPLYRKVEEYAAVVVDAAVAGRTGRG